MQQQIPKDDILDVKELSEKIMLSNYEILKDQDYSLALSAMMTATVNSLVHQSNSIYELKIYRDALIKIIDNAIDLNEKYNSMKPFDLKFLRNTLNNDYDADQENEDEVEEN